MDLLHQIFEGGHVLNEISGWKPAMNRWRVGFLKHRSQINKEGWGGITMPWLYFPPEINKCHPALPVFLERSEYKLCWGDIICKGGFESLHAASIMDLRHQIFEFGHVLSELNGSKPATSRWWFGFLKHRSKINKEGCGGITLFRLYFSSKINNCYPVLPVFLERSEYKLCWAHMPCPQNSWYHNTKQQTCLSLQQWLKEVHSDDSLVSFTRHSV